LGTGEKFGGGFLQTAFGENLEFLIGIDENLAAEF